MDQELSNYKKNFQQHGYVLLKNFLNQEEFNIFKNCAAHIQSTPEKPGVLMKYFELSSKDNQELLNRAEYFLDEYKELKHIAFGKKIKRVIKELTGDDFILFKEKINYKLPGGGGFSVHQDAPAFTRFSTEELIILMIPVDKVDESNGCLQVADNYFDKKLIQHTNGVVEDKILSTINWKNIPLDEGDVLIFSSFLLHQSFDNRSDKPRRCYYLTYNLEKLGNLRDQYFSYKRQNFPPRIERQENANYEQWKLKLAKKLI